VNATRVSVERLTDDNGIEIVDRIQRQRSRLATPDPVTPRTADTDEFRFPVETAMTVETAALTVPEAVPVIVRDTEGQTVATADSDDSVTLSRGTYSLDICTQLKTYVRTTSAVRVSIDDARTRVEFGDTTRVVVGVRSRHERPAATVTTTETPTDVMAAVETFGSALKTTSPERSFPTLRGHPPAVTLGDELHVPPAVRPPDTGVTLELPRRLSAVTVAAPLAYYTGAAVEPGPAPRLLTDDGFEYPLTGPDGYEVAVERTLKQLFVLDCVTRTEGLYQVPLDERRRLEPELDLDFGSLYDRPLSAQIERYLSIPYRTVADRVPEWRLTTHVDPTGEAVRALPYLVDDLAVVRTRPDTRDDVGDPVSDSQTFSRTDVVTRAVDDGGDDLEYVEPRATDSVERGWLGDAVPVGASKLSVEAFRNRLDRSPVDGDLAVTVVENDSRMADERRIADEVYGTRGDHHDVPLDVTVRRNLTRAELAATLAEPTELLHFVGHASTDGLSCTDGPLDLGTLDDVAVETFVLNACDSYDQGLTLVERGAVGGIVTLTDVVNDHAVRIGGTIARLLNLGFPLRPALTLARDVSPAGGQYIVVGDGGITVTQAPGGTPTLLDVTPTETGYEVELTSFATDNRELGTIFKPFLTDEDRYYLSSGTTDTFEVPPGDLEAFLGLQDVPLRVEGDLYWSGECSLADIS
jgi:hypothetical protein